VGCDCYSRPDRPSYDSDARGDVIRMRETYPTMVRMDQVERVDDATTKLTTEQAVGLLGVSSDILWSWEHRFGYPRAESSPDGEPMYVWCDVVALRDALMRDLSITSAIRTAQQALNQICDARTTSSSGGGRDPLPIARQAQPVRALERANEIRRARAQLKRRIGAGHMSAAEVLLDCPVEASTWPVADLLASQRDWGNATSSKFLARNRISEGKPIGELTERQRRLLAAQLTSSR
jgi:hypothetical protein